MRLIVVCRGTQFLHVDKYGRTRFVPLRKATFFDNKADAKSYLTKDGGKVMELYVTIHRIYNDHEIHTRHASYGQRLGKRDKKPD